MKYRKCLWCGDFFWAYYTEKTCSEDCARLRRNEKAEKARKRRVAKEKAIRAKLEKKFVTAPV
jgi:hypothetical protein